MKFMKNIKHRHHFLLKEYTKRIVVLRKMIQQLLLLINLQEN